MTGAHGQMPVGNLLCTSSAIFRGEMDGRIDFFMSMLNLQNIGHTKFYEVQKEKLLAAINTAYEINMNQVRSAIGDTAITACGQGRCDSPGYNAKYCSYTFMSSSTHHIIGMALVQVTMATRCGH